MKGPLIPAISYYPSVNLVKTTENPYMDLLPPGQIGRASHPRFCCAYRACPPHHAALLPTSSADAFSNAHTVGPLPSRFFGGLLVDTQRQLLEFLDHSVHHMVMDPDASAVIAQGPAETRCVYVGLIRMSVFAYSMCWIQRG